MAVLTVLCLAACRQDMHDQPKYEPLEQAEFFGDAMSARPVVAGTVARGHLHDDEHLYTGRIRNTFANSFPFEITGDVMKRGRERYDIFCSPCHGRTGDGDGMIVRRGYRRPPSFHDDRLRDVAVGHYFDVMTNGFGAMPEYRTQVSPHDRWAIIAYVRALQFSRRATIADVPAEDRRKLEGTWPVAPSQRGERERAVGGRGGGARDVH
ncbi:MAG: cytochrome c [Acidobacteria bacterium]|nr:cytochrome c [Acidobacteriota bacterium]